MDTKPCTDSGEHIAAQRHAKTECPAAIDTAPCEARGRHETPADHNHWGYNCTVRPTVDDIWSKALELGLDEEPRTVHALELGEVDVAIIREAIGVWVKQRRTTRPDDAPTGYSSVEFHAEMIVEELPFPALPKPRA